MLLILASLTKIQLQMRVLGKWGSMCAEMGDQVYKKSIFCWSLQTVKLRIQSNCSCGTMQVDPSHTITVIIINVHHYLLNTN